jgi:hypothetical protein
MFLGWSGTVASIPWGWQLCDGSNGLPDFRDRFIIGAGGTYAPGESVGAASHTHTTNIAHGHTFLEQMGDLDVPSSGDYDLQESGGEVESSAADNKPLSYAYCIIGKL